MFSQWKWELLLAGKEKASALPFFSTFSAYVDKSLDVHSLMPMHSECQHGALQMSIYWKSVEYWLKCFGTENVLVLNVEEYLRDPKTFMRTIHEFVGLPHMWAQCSENKVNENPLALPPPDERTVAKLTEFFKPHNRKLWQLLGRKFDW